MDVNMIQALVDGMSAQWMKQRAETQMTLGKLIAALSAMPPDAQIAAIQNAHSYRGYYSDLAFELPQSQSDKLTVAEVLQMCRDCMGQVFEGYKGGDFVMGANTPLWIADYGCCGSKLIGVNPDGTLITCEEEI